MILATLTAAMTAGLWRELIAIAVIAMQQDISVLPFRTTQNGTQLEALFDEVSAITVAQVMNRDVLVNVATFYDGFKRCLGS